MVVLYVRGLPVGPLNENKDELANLLLRGEDVEFRSESGEKLAYVGPKEEPICPWDKTLTRADLDRMHAEGGGMTLAELLKRAGVQ
jgi:hypothetical protein